MAAPCPVQQSHLRSPTRRHNARERESQVGKRILIYRRAPSTFRERLPPHFHCTQKNVEAATQLRHCFLDARCRGLIPLIFLPAFKLRRALCSCRIIWRSFCIYPPCKDGAAASVIQFHSLHQLDQYQKRISGKGRRPAANEVLLEDRTLHRGAKRTHAL
jgi:hypothetical protein